MPDAPAPDAAAVADAADGLPVSVSVTTTSGDGEPDKAAVVFFMDASGSVVATVSTEGDGTGRAIVPPGGSVTVLQVSTAAGSTHETLTTIREVEAGDHLHVGPARTVASLSNNPDTMSSNVPTHPSGDLPSLLFACGNAYIAGNPGDTAVFTFYDNCRPDTFDVLGMSHDADGHDVYFWQPANSHAMGGALALDTPWERTSTSKLTVSNVPTAALSISAELSLDIGGFMVQIDRQSGTVDAGSGTIELLRTEPDAATRSALVLTQQGVFGRGPLDELVRVGPSATLAGDLAFDASVLPLPEVSHVVQTKTGATWSASGATGDVRLVTWRGGWDQHDVVWTVVEPATAPTGTRFPALPADYASFDAGALATGLGGVGVRYFDYDNLDGYAACRADNAQLLLVESAFPKVDHVAHMVVAASPAMH